MFLFLQIGPGSCENRSDPAGQKSPDPTESESSPLVPKDSVKKGKIKRSQNEGRRKFRKKREIDEKGGKTRDKKTVDLNGISYQFGLNQGHIFCI